MKWMYLVFICLASCVGVVAQEPDMVYASNIKSVKLFVYGNQLAYPVIKLNSGDRLELHFDDINGGVRNYSYTYILCNADWTPAILSYFDYIKGFSQSRINTYRNSSLAATKYTHYQVTLPENNSTPSRSGNYLLKVFADGDTSKVLFAKRMLVIDEKAVISSQIQQPFNGEIFKTHQKLPFVVNTGKIGQMVSPMQQVKVTILQNSRWDNAVKNLRPTFIRPGSLEFSTENDIVFGAGREWRWLDLRSFRLQSDRVENAVYNKTSTEIFVRPDLDRSQQRFVFYRDINGMYYNDVTESINPLWQADYATVHFRYVPPGKIAFPGKDVYLMGELSNYGKDPNAKMVFNPETAMYETSLFLKQGYYDYAYATVEANARNWQPSFNFTEGNFWDTENTYTILVYYRAIGGRADELIGLSTFSSLTARQGIGGY